MAYPAAYDTTEFLDTFTEASDTALSSHTPDTDTSAGGWTYNGTPTLTVIGADDELSGVSDNNGNRASLASMGITTDILIHGDFYMPTGETGAAAYGPRLWVGDDRQVAMGIDVATSGGSVLLYYNSATDGYVTTAIDTIDDAAWLETPREYAIERRGDTLYGYIDGVELGSLDMSLTTDFAGLPSSNPAFCLGRFGGTSGRVVRCDNFTVLSKSGGLVIGQSMNRGINRGINRGAA